MTKSSPAKLAYQAEYQKKPSEVKKRVARNAATARRKNRKQ